MLRRNGPAHPAKLGHAQMSWLWSWQGVPEPVASRIAECLGPPASGAPLSRPSPGQTLRTWQPLLPALPVAFGLPQGLSTRQLALHGRALSALHQAEDPPTQQLMQQ